MHRPNTCAAFIAGTMILAAGCSTPKATIVEYGVFEAKAVKSVGADGTTLKHVISLEDIALVDKTDAPVATVGLRFGVRYRLNQHGAATNTVTISLDHPPLTNPKTKKISTIERWKQKVKSDAVAYAGFTMDSEWEAVPGDWTFGIWLEEEKLAEKTFFVKER